MPSDSIELFKASIKKISEMESYTNYGMPMLVHKYKKLSYEKNIIVLGLGK